VVRVAALVFSLALLAAVPAASAPTYYFRVTGGSMTIVSRVTEAAEGTGTERIDWSVAPHTRGTRPAPGFPTADGAGGLRTFQLRFPARGTYAYDFVEEDSGKCTETIALAPASRGTVAVRQVGTRVRVTWGLDPQRRKGYVPPLCRPAFANNALLFFLAQQAYTTVSVPASSVGKTTFTLAAQGTFTGQGSSVSWKLTLGVRRLGVRR
jgi:hypothetical protein